MFPTERQNLLLDHREPTKEHPQCCLKVVGRKDRVWRAEFFAHPGRTVECHLILGSPHNALMAKVHRNLFPDGTKQVRSQPSPELDSCAALPEIEHDVLYDIFGNIARNRQTGKSSESMGIRFKDMLKDIESPVAEADDPCVILAWTGRYGRDLV